MKHHNRVRIDAADIVIACIVKGIDIAKERVAAWERFIEELDSCDYIGGGGIATC